MTNFLRGILFTVVVGIVLAFCAVKFGLIPANADATPSGMERQAAGMARRAWISAHAPTGANPVAITDDNLIAGMKIYTMDCAECHGALDRKPSAFGPALYPAAPNLIADPVDDDPEGETFYVTKHGIRLSGMPAWTGMLTDDDIWKVTAFLKRMPDLPPAVKQHWKDSTGVDAPSSGK